MSFMASHDVGLLNKPQTVAGFQGSKSDIGLSMLTINMHGFNQSCDFLTETCDSGAYDIIHIQEHWLSNENLHKLAAISPSYIMYGESAMGSATSGDVLFGRPFGGCCSLLKCELAAVTTCCLITDRIVALIVAGSLFINLYLPCEDNADSKELIIDILAQVATVINDNSYDYICMGGDFNTDLNSNRKHSKIVIDFLDAHGMHYCKLNNSTNYTFSNEKRNCYSTIDFWCITSDLLQYISSYNTVDNAINFSDHLPVQLCVSLPDNNVLARGLNMGKGMFKEGIRARCATDRANTRDSVNERPDSYRLRFDHSNHALYYECTRVLLEPILASINAEYMAKQDLRVNEPDNCDRGRQKIEIWYSNIVQSLNQAALFSVPRVRSGGLKHFWDAELDELKRLSIESHRLWVDAGKPRSGEIYLARTSARFKYRARINEHKISEKMSVSSDLQDSLLSKKSKDFWKTWKSKVCNTKRQIPSVNGCFDESIVVDQFKAYFEKACSNNSAEYNEKIKREFEARLIAESENAPLVDKELYTAEAVALAVANLNPGKAACFDGLQSEHLTYCHPIIYTVLSRLFYFILLYGHVPADFACGMLVPIPKDSGAKRALEINQFRGITVSPIISKVFENCLLTIYQNYLTTSDHQFGFKKKTSCSHAIYSVRYVIDHFVKNDTTVNVCCLDISKAFDKVNYNCLFLKLISRNAPICFINVLHNWYAKSMCRVKWGNLLSIPFSLQGGVRQGGVLSPLLFSIYVDDILKKLENFGCYLHGTSMSAFMYADDLILLSPSVVELQRMVDLCCVEFEGLDLQLNCSKSVCMRIGPRWHKHCSPITTKTGAINWATEATYLGVKILAGKKFNVSLDDCKSNFYSSFNALYSQLGKLNNVLVSLHLASTIALPCLLYAVETMPFTKSFLNCLEHPWTRIFMKIFNTFDIETVLNCQYFTGYLPLAHLARIRKVNFLVNMGLHDNSIIRTVHSLSINDELKPIAQFYDVSVEQLAFKCNQLAKNFIMDQIDSEL